MSEPELLDLEYAALMHDIGQLSLAEPIPGGATVLASPEDQRRIAGLGASVIEQAGVLDRVAEIVRCQSLPWRGGPGSRRSAAGSSGPPTPSTTWSAGRRTGTGPRRRWNGSGWTPRRSTTRVWWRR